MRLLFVLLLIGNGVFFVLAGGYLGRYLPDGREPERLNQQISPERIRVLADEAPAPAPARNAAAPAKAAIACIEMGGFTGDEVRRIETQLEQLGLTSRMTQRKTDEQAGFIVYLPPFSNRAAAENAASELRRIGINDFYVINDTGPLKMGISLGVFKTEEAAKDELTSLSQLGVKNAKSAAHASTVTRNYYQLRNIDAEQLAKLNDIRSQYRSGELHDCPASAAPAVSSSGT